MENVPFEQVAKLKKQCELDYLVHEYAFLLNDYLCLLFDGEVTQEKRQGVLNPEAMIKSLEGYAAFAKALRGLDENIQQQGDAIDVEALWPDIQLVKSYWIELLTYYVNITVYR